MSATRVMPRRGLLGLILAVHWLPAPTSTRAAEPPDQSPAGTRSAPRPRVGLVLSGGGARGAAHIGVLKVLEQLQVPVDAIAGTSMGAVVGGLYASGLSPGEIEKIMTSVNWQQAFRDRPPREDLTLRRKQEDETFLVKFPLYVQDGRVLLPKGLIQGQTLTQMLRRLTLPVALVNNFDELPTPFRAVATDLETGDAVVMRDGDLTSAMRASLSAPGVFAPVERDGRLLVDGGLADNVPVDVARAMGVDRVIVVDVGFPLQARRRLSNAPAISNQSVAILIQRNARAQLATLTRRDVLIQPALGDVSSFDFGSVARVISIGENAARGQTGQLAAFTVSSADMQRYHERRQQPRTAPPRIDFVRVDPGSERYALAASSLLSDLTGKPLDPQATARRVTALYGRGGLDTLDYHIVGEPGHYGLALDARPSSQGSNYLRFGLSLQDDFEGNSAYSAAMRFVMGDITRNAGEWVTDLQIGSVAKIATELFLPLARFSGWFVMPHAAIGSHDLDIVQDQNLLAEYRVHDSAAGLDFGRQFGNWGEIRAGAQLEHGHFFLKVGDPTAPGLPPPDEVAPFDLHDYFLRLTYDRLDDVNFPHRGQRANVQWSGYHAASATQQTNEQLTANYLGAYSRGRDTLSFSASGGMTLQSTLSNINLLFPLGGFLNLSGLRTNSLLGPNYGIARLLYYRQIGRGGPGYFDVPTYLGASLEAGNVWQTRSEASLSNTRKNASVFLGMDTFLGPVYLAAGFDQHGDQAFYLFLGKTF